MVYERFELYYRKLIAKTEACKVKWRPIMDYIDDHVSLKCDDSGLAQHLQTIYFTEWFDLFIDKSFFAQKGNYILALLNYKSESAKDGTVNEVLQLVGCLKEKAPIKFFPEYLPGGFAELQKAIINYWKRKEMDYCLEISDSLEILGAFTEED